MHDGRSWEQSISGCASECFLRSNRVLLPFMVALNLRRALLALCPRWSACRQLPFLGFRPPGGLQFAKAAPCAHLPFVLNAAKVGCPPPPTTVLDVSSVSLDLNQLFPSGTKASSDQSKAEPSDPLCWARTVGTGYWMKF